LWDLGLARVDLDASTGPTAWTTFVTPSFANATGANYLAVLPIRTDTPITVYIRQYGVELLAGAHAIQPTAGSRAWLRNRYNQFQWSEDITNAVWSKSGLTVTGNAGVAPDGTTTADRITAGATGYYLQTNATVNGANATVRASLRVKNEDYTSADTMYFNLSDGVSGFIPLVFKPFDGTFTTPAPASSWSNVSRTVTSIGDGWYVLTITGTTTQWTSGWMEVGASTAHNRSCLVWGHDLRRGNDTAYPYQWIRSATDYDSDPLRFPVYLEADGVATSMYTPANLDLSSTDKVTIFSAITKLSDAAGTTALELSAASETNNGAFALFAPGSGGFAEYYWRVRGSNTVNVNYANAAIAAPNTSVLAMLADISGDSAISRVNGAQVASSASDLGTGNFGSYPLYLFARAGTSLFFRGRFYASVIRGALTPVSRAAAVEQQLNVQALGKVY
jgi:hypothetical protein